MNISLKNLVRHSNFEHYHFIVDARYFEEGTIIESSYKNDTMKFYFEHPKVDDSGFRYYELSDCIRMHYDYANIISAWIDISKVFSFKDLKVNFETKTAYIHLIRK